MEVTRRVMISLISFSQREVIILGVQVKTQEELIIHCLLLVLVEVASKVLTRVEWLNLNIFFKLINKIDRSFFLIIKTLLRRGEVVKHQ